MKITDGFEYFKNRNPSSRFYVYLHKRKTDGSIFYVGKGCSYRAWHSKGRNNHWNNIVNKHGFEVEILFDGLNEEESLQIEKDVILELKYFGYKLCNYTSGGDSPRFSKESILKMSAARKGIKKSKEHISKIADANRGKKRPMLSGINNPNFDKNIYEFIHIDNLTLFVGTRTELCDKYSLDASLLRGLFLKNRNRKISQRWGLFNKDISVEENVKYLTTNSSVGTTVKYLFMNKDGITFYGTRRELSESFDISLDLIHGLFSVNPRVQAKGWFLVKE